MDLETRIERLDLIGAQAAPFEGALDAEIVSTTPFIDLRAMDISPLSPQATRFIAQFGAHEQKNQFSMSKENSDAFNNSVADWLTASGDIDGLVEHTGWRMANKVRKFAETSDTTSEPLWIPVPYIDTKTLSWQKIDAAFRFMASRHLAQIANVDIQPFTVPEDQHSSEIRIGKFLVQITEMHRCVEDDKPASKYQTYYEFKVEN